MKERRLTEKQIQTYSIWLHEEEKSAATCEKYLRDVRKFMHDNAGAPITKESVAQWKQQLIEQLRSFAKRRRIYIMSTGVEHRRKIERMGLVVS